MIKWISMGLGVLTIVWMVLQRDQLAFASILAGGSLASTLYVLLSNKKTEVVPQAAVEEKLEWKMKLEESEAKSAQTIDALNKELQKQQQKAIRAEERCNQFQKLVDVHQHEIEKQRLDNQNIGEQLIQKERKLNALYLAKMEPDLFDHDRHHVESINRELKKKLKEKRSESRDLLS
jgi:hypothetical protein